MFTACGYHAARLDDIAEAAGISAPALYRHFPNKYALFSETTRRLADVITEAVAAVPPDLPADAELPALLAALARTSMSHRHTGGLYRWERHYLAAEDAEDVRQVVQAQHRRVRSALARRTSGRSTTELNTVAAAMIAVVASPTTHGTAMGARPGEVLVTDAALRLADVDVRSRTERSTMGSGLPPATKREVLLAESIRLFADRGFGEVTVENIARACDLPASGFYRYFESKSAILNEALWRTSDRVTAAIADTLAEASTPRDAIVDMTARYVRLCRSSPDLITVYVAEAGNLDPGQRRALRNQQRICVDEWAAWVASDRPDVSAAQARFLVMAALNVIHDLTRGNHCPAADVTRDLAWRILVDPEPRTDPASDGRRR